jgi:hypothetical protein
MTEPVALFLAILDGFRVFHSRSFHVVGVRFGVGDGGSQQFQRLEIEIDFDFRPEGLVQQVQSGVHREVPAIADQQQQGGTRAGLVTRWFETLREPVSLRFSVDVARDLSDEAAFVCRVIRTTRILQLPWLPR